MGNDQAAFFFVAVVELLKPVFDFLDAFLLMSETEILAPGPTEILMTLRLISVLILVMAMILLVKSELDVVSSYLMWTPLDASIVVGYEDWSTQVISLWSDRKKIFSKHIFISSPSSSMNKVYVSTGASEP